MAISPPEKDSHAAGSGSSTGDPGNARGPKSSVSTDKPSTDKPNLPDPKQPGGDYATHGQNEAQGSRLRKAG